MLLLEPIVVAQARVVEEPQKVARQFPRRQKGWIVSRWEQVFSFYTLLVQVQQKQTNATKRMRHGSKEGHKELLF
jgi:hypothetical protein